MLVRFRLPATAAVKFLVITAGDTADSGMHCATSQARKGFSERWRLTIVASAKTSLLFERGQELPQMMVVKQLFGLLGGC
jgi:hypothetical protein